MAGKFSTGQAANPSFRPSGHTKAHHHHPHSRLRGAAPDTEEGMAPVGRPLIEGLVAEAEDVNVKDIESVINNSNKEGVSASERSALGDAGVAGGNGDGDENDPQKKDGEGKGPRPAKPEEGTESVVPSRRRRNSHHGPIGRKRAQMYSNLRERPRHILLPHGKFRSVWDFYMGFLLIYVGAFVPYRLSYLGNLSGPMKAVEVFVDISFGVDIVLNFFTAFERPDGLLEYRMSSIAKKYVKGYFFLDMVATFPFELVIKAMEATSGVNHASKLTKLPKLMKIVKMTRFLKLLRVYRLTKFIREVEINYNIHHGISRLVNIVVVIMFATHLVGCLWHAIGVELDIDRASEECNLEDVAASNEGGWICREGLDNRSPGHKYIASLYWAFSTLTTVGYGDINARTIGEQTFSMLMMLLGVSWYAYVVGSMSAIVSSFDRQNKQMRMKMLQVNTFVREAKLPPTLCWRVQRYFEYSLSKKKNGLFGYDADEILGELSTSLRTDIILHVEKDLIAKIPFFDGKSPTFVAHAIQVFQPVVVQGGDFIIKEGSAADEMFFLVKGVAAVYYGDKKITEMSEGMYFGEIGCILGGIRRASIKADTLCELQCLSKRNLNLLLGQHPEVGEDLKKVARSRMKEVKKTQKDKPQKVRVKKHETKKPRETEENKTERVPPKGKEESADTPVARGGRRKSIAEQNLDKLDQVDFGKLEDESEAFADLKTELDGMARRLSLTSGRASGGTHIVTEKALQEMNNDLPRKGEKASTPSKARAKDIVPPMRMASDQERLSAIFNSLEPADREAVHNFILQTVADLLGRKLTDLTDRLIDNNARVLATAKEKLKEHLKKKSVRD